MDDSTYFLVLHLLLPKQEQTLPFGIGISLFYMRINKYKQKG